MDEPLETTETFKELSMEACRESRGWETIVEDKAYQCAGTGAHDKVIGQVVKDHVRLYRAIQITPANIDEETPNPAVLG